MQRSISLEYQIKPPPLIKSDTLVTGMPQAGELGKICLGSPLSLLVNGGVRMTLG